MSKKCYKCGITYENPQESFHKCKNRYDGLQGTCKLCSNKRNKSYYWDNKESQQKRQIKWRENKKKTDENYYPRKYLKNKNILLENSKKYNETVKGRLMRLLNQAKIRAKNKNIPFDINFEFIYNLWLNQNGTCLLTGNKFILKRGVRENELFYQHPYAPCIDKIESSKGYTKDNVRLICNHMNTALWDYGQEKLDFLIKSYLKTTKNIEIDI